jgi:hypothetical protein
MPLTAGTWQANVNGQGAFLLIQAPDQNGVFSGTLAGLSISGFWDEIAQFMTFAFRPARTGFPDLSEHLAVFTGYLFRSPVNPAPGQDVTATLAGFVQVPPSDSFFVRPGLPIDGTSRRNIFGWYAQINEVVQ